MGIERIIFIDDDTVNNSLSKIIVRQAIGSFNTLTFEKPAEALAHIENEYGQGWEREKVLVLLDINMPVMNGWTFLDRVSAMPKETQDNLMIYILSSSIDPRDKERAERHELVQGYISKPLGPPVLRNLIFPNEVQNTASQD